MLLEKRIVFLEARENRSVEIRGSCARVHRGEEIDLNCPVVRSVIFRKKIHGTAGEKPVR